MGKRKGKAPTAGGGKRKVVLDTTFRCLFCNHDNSVTVQLDKKTGQGHLKCKTCAQTFSTQINYLTAAVDVYYEWVDACDAVQNGQDGGSVKATRQPAPLRRGSTGAGADDDLDGSKIPTTKAAAQISRSKHTSRERDPEETTRKDKSGKKGLPKRSKVEERLETIESGNAKM